MTLEAAGEPFTAIGITEGEKKQRAAEQAKLPCIGLSGVWNWQKRRDRDELGQATGERQLLDDLAAIDWRKRPVWICFDSDPRRNADVNHARAELWRILEKQGANVHIITLPHGPRDTDGIHIKQAVDDFIVRHGEDAFRNLVEEQMRWRPMRSLDEYRQQIGQSRIESVGTPGIYLDTSPTGSGKSHADRKAADMAGTSLTIEPTHKNCEQTESDYQKHGLDAAAYPKLDGKSCQNLDEAERALKHGLTVSGAVCVGCSFRDSCDYRHDLEIAENSPHRIATHHRASLSFAELAKERGVN
jgi:hypothetical protein